MKIINEIVYEINSVINENKVINLNLRNSLNSLSDSVKKMNINNYNNMNFNTSLDISEKNENNIFNNNSDKKTVIFKKFGKEQNYIYDTNTQLSKVIRSYLEYTGGLKMPKKPIIFLKIFIK